MEDRRARLTRLCLALTEAACRGERHLRFSVRSRTFAYYLEDHHGDGRVALACKVAVPPGATGLGLALLASQPSVNVVVANAIRRGGMANRHTVAATSMMHSAPRRHTGGCNT